MALTDMGLDQLREYRPTIAEPEDFDEFWTTTLSEARQFDLDPIFEPIDAGTPVFDTYDLTFTGFGGTRVKGWFITPAGAAGPLPTVVEFLGYSGGRGLPFARQTFAAAGWAYVIMDTRGQGWASGGYDSTPDDTADSGRHHAPGFMTAGLTDPKAYYYRRVFTDAIRCLEAIRTSPLVDPSKVVVTGNSQGGGISIATAGLAPIAGIDLVGCAPNVPFLCHFTRAVQVASQGPYPEIVRYLAGWRDEEQTAYRTLSYFDGVNLGKRANVPSLFSVALMDDICPASTVYAAYHSYGERAAARPEKSIEVYSHNGHEGGADYQTQIRLDWFAKLFTA